MANTIQDLIRKNSKALNSNSPLVLDSGSSFEDNPLETLRAIQSGEVQDALIQQSQQGSLLGDTAGAFALGAANMLNNTLVGGTGLVLGGMGRGVEAISPFSGRDNELYNQLLDFGTSGERAEELAPYEDSWLTSAAKGSLAVHNSIDDTLKDWRTQIIGENPSQLAEIFEGTGSSIAFLLAGLLLGHSPLAGALIAGSTESLSEAGGFLGDAYRQGQYDNGALSTAGKNFLANLALNTGLNATIGRFNPKIDAIKNPFKRWAVGGLAEIGNELLQEPSQQVIEQASQNSLNNGTDFSSELWQSAQQWPEMFAKLAPTVAASTALTQLLLGGGYLSTRSGRQDVATQSVLSRYDTRRQGNKPDGKLLLQTHQPDINALRAEGIKGLQSQLENMQSQLYNAYADYGTDIDTEPDKEAEVMDLFAKIQRLDSDINDYLNPPQPEPVQQETIQSPTSEESTAPDIDEEEAPVKPKKNGKKGRKRKKKGEDERPDRYYEDEDEVPEGEKLSGFVPTSDTVRAYEAQNKLGSNTARIRTAKGTEVDVRYRVVDIDDLIASTKENGAPNPEYPQELQPRQRERYSSDEQIDKIARTLDPELLGANRLASDGAPVIGSDMVVESGNGRILGLRRAYKIGNTEHYRNYLRDNAAMFGLSPDDVDTVAKPVLVRERIGDTDRVKFTSEANEASIATLSSSEHALDDAKLITTEMLGYYDSEKPLEGNKEFVSRLIGKMPANERGDLIQADGRFSVAGFERVRNAIAAKAYHDSSIINRLSEAFDDEVKNISNALIQAAPQLAIFEDINQRPENSITEDIKQAVSILVDLRNRKIKVSEYIAQPPLLADDVETEEARKLLAFFDRNKRSAKRIAEGLIRYAEIAREEANPNQLVMFEDSIRSKADMLDSAIAFAENSQEERTVPAKKGNKKEKISSKNETHSNNFKKWFGDWEQSNSNSSKVVDKKGAPLIVYHGTDAESKDGLPPFSVFNVEGKNNGVTQDTSGTGAWFHSNRKAAHSYGEYIYSVYLNIRNPYIYDAKGKDKKKIAKIKDQIVRDVRAGKYGEGYDGVIFRNIEDVKHYFDFQSSEEAVGDVYVVFDRRQIKSATDNNGQYSDPENIFKQSSNEENLRQEFKQKIIDAHRSEEEAEQLSHIYIAGNKYFSRYTGIPLDRIIQADNLITNFQETIDNDSDVRGRTIFRREQRDIFGDLISEAQTIIQLAQSSDKSSALHETAGHIFLDKFRRLAASGQLKGLAKQDWTTLIKELGVQDIDFSQALSGEDKARWADAHEKFATSIEKYFMTGEAPSSKMKHVFEAFKRWLKDIYTSLKNIRYMGSDGQLHSFNISPEFKEVLDHMFGDTQNEQDTLNQSRKSDNNFVDKDTVEQYDQRYFYSSGKALKDHKFDLADPSIDKDNFAWGVLATEWKYAAQQRRQNNLPFSKRGYTHFIDRDGNDIENVLRNMKRGQERKILERLFSDLKWELEKQRDKADFETIKANLNKRYQREREAIRNNPGRSRAERERASNMDYFIFMLQNALRNLKGMEQDEVSQGNLYDIEGPDEKLMLDWDTPIEKQPEAIQKAARGIEEQLKLWGIELWPTSKGKLFSANLVEDVTGEKFYRALVKAMQKATFRDLISSKKFGKISNPKMAASLMLYRFGVPGVKAKGKLGDIYSIWDTTQLKVRGVSQDSTDVATKPFRDMQPEPEPEEKKGIPIRLIGRKAGEDINRGYQTEVYNQPDIQSGSLRLNGTPKNFISDETFEIFNQDTYMGTGHIIKGEPNLQHNKEGSAQNFEGYGVYTSGLTYVGGQYRYYGLGDDFRAGYTIHLKNGQIIRNIFDEEPLYDSWAIVEDGKKHLARGSEKLALNGIAEYFYEQREKRNPAITQVKLDKGQLPPYAFDYTPLLQEAIDHYIQETKEKIARERGKTNAEYLELSIEYANDLAQNIDSITFNNASGEGNVYTVEVPEDYELLDWDARLSEQPDEIQEKLRDKIDDFYPEVDWRKTALEKIKSMPNEEFQKWLAEQSDKENHSQRATGQDLYKWLSDKLGGDKNASMWLMAQGIPGHRYIDETTTDISTIHRVFNNSEDIHNYVIWDESRIKLKRNDRGIPEGDLGRTTRYYYEQEAKKQRRRAQRKKKAQQDETYDQISPKRKQDMDALLASKRPDLSPEQRSTAITEIEKLGEQYPKGRQDNNPKLEKIATHWMIEGHIRLPEDNYKIIDALRLCEQHKLDPLSVRDPNEILAKYTIKERRSDIDLDKVPEFSEKKEYEHGITVYTVDNTKAGMEAVRRIIDAHWGKDANPWCLAARQNGSLDKAWGFWNDYNNPPTKRIAFINGLLLAFSASNKGITQWWNKKDISFDYIPYTVKEDGDTKDYVLDEETGKTRLLREALADGTRRYYRSNGQLWHEFNLNAVLDAQYYKGGQLESARLPDGTKLVFYENGVIANEVLPNTEKREYSKNGQLYSERLNDGIIKYYDEHGQLESALLPNGTRRLYKDGQQWIDFLPNDMMREYNKNGQIIREQDADGTIRDYDENGQPTHETYNQAAFSPRGTLGKLLGGLVKKTKNIFAPSAPATDTRNTDELKFSSEETEKRYSEAKKGVLKPTLIGRIKHSASQLIRSLKGDFPALSGKEAERKGLLFAKEQFRMLQKKKASQVKQAMQTFTDNLRGLSDYQLDLFARKRLLDDLMWRKENYPDAELPFGFSDDMLKKEFERFAKLAKQDAPVLNAIHAEENAMKKISQDFIRTAGELGLNLEGVLRNPHYYRHTILEYANAAALGKKKYVSRNNESLQDFVDAQLRGVTSRSYLKHYKGSPLDISANYVQANGEVRAQMLMDIEAMKTLLQIKKKYDIAPNIRGKLKNALSQQQEGTQEAHNQPGDTPASLSDIIPDGYSMFDPAGSRLIQSANSATENIISMAIDDAAQQSGLPLDRLLQSLGDFGEDAINRLLVLPDEIISSLNSISRSRERGMLGNAAKTLTNWWKKAVLFSPTRNIKYNFRNFTGDLDALIAGNPMALKFLPKAVKDLTAHMRGKETPQEVKDYVYRAGGMNIESMQLTFADIQGMEHWADDIDHEDLASWKNISKKGWKAVKSFFKNEVAFTTWREHLLRYTAYLQYLQDMKQHRGKPSSWGASLQNEVMAIPDIRDKAYKMSNELLGAYDEVSEFGKQLRDLAIPFWSWSEINVKRYYRLLKNGLSGQNSSDFAKRFLLGKSTRIPFLALSAAETFGKISLLTLLAQAFNRFVVPDDDDQLPPEVKYKPHITFGKANGRIYYFDRIGALADTAEWGGLDNIFIDAMDIKDGRLSWADYMKKVITAPVGKLLNQVNPLFRMPYELATGRTIFPDVSNPRNIRDNGQYIAQTFGLSWPYKSATGQIHSNWNEFVNIFANSTDADEAAYFYSLGKVRQFQERVLDQSSDVGIATTQKGKVLQKLKQALRMHDNETVRECLKEYKKLGGSDKGFKASMRSMNPLFGLDKDEQKRFLQWITDDDKKYLRRANRFFHQLADRYLR